MDIKEEINKLLDSIGSGRMSNTAYDTAWIARLGDIDWEISSQALNWLCEHQLLDGSWGANHPFYYHDRVISTLSSMIALNYRGRRSQDRKQIENGLIALERITSGATKGLQADPNGATVGFEMIVPTLVAEAERLNIIQKQGERILGRLSRFREKKMEMLAGRKISKLMTPAFSSEMAGFDGKAMLDTENLQEQNGSIANSPSATAYFALYIRPNDESARNYLDQVVTMDGGAPDFAPIDIFEVAWTLWNLRLITNLDSEIKSALTPHLDFLEKNWNQSFGIGTASNGTIKDGDDTGLVFEVLSYYGRQMDVNSIFYYEDDNYFRCFALETNPSISANIHILGALRQAGYEKDHPSVRKIIKFLHSTVTTYGFWFDKWHASPYYATSHAIITCSGYENSIVQNSVDWVIKSQNINGSWGYYGTPTSEETAYCIQALSIWERVNANPLSREAIKRGISWLRDNMYNSNTPLWIGKALYCPEKVVKSSIFSAISLGSNLL